MSLHTRLVNLFQSMFPDNVLDFSKGVDQQHLQAWDSIKYVMIVFAVEEEFDIKLSNEEILEFTSFDKILEILNARGI